MTMQTKFLGLELATWLCLIVTGLAIWIPLGLVAVTAVYDLVRWML